VFQKGLVGGQTDAQQRGAQSVQDVYLLMLNDAGQIYFSAKEPI